jgi:hypothetical protein
VTARASRRRFNAVEHVALLGAMLLAVLAAFYVINPEYYLLVVPCLLAVVPWKRYAWLVLFGLSVPWAVNFFYGVALGMSAEDPGRAPFASAYRFFFGSIDPWFLHEASVVGCSALTWLLAFGLWAGSLGAFGRAIPRTAE